MEFPQWIKELFERGRQRYQPQPFGQTVEGLKDWHRTPLAKAILAQQGAQLEKVLSDVFGYHLLELSSLTSSSFAHGSRINHCFKLCPLQGYGAQALSEPERMPLDDESIDVVLLHHVLEFSANPHQVLREANRVLIPRGHLIIVGFNPLSLQGLWRLLFQWFSGRGFWRRHSLGARRVTDWLNVLDCEQVSVQRGFYRPPVNNEGILAGLNFLEKLCQSLKLPCGGYYILVARKDRLSLRPIKPGWGRFKPVVGLLGEPAPRLPQVAGQHTVHRGTQRAIRVAAQRGQPGVLASRQRAHWHRPGGDTGACENDSAKRRTKCEIEEAGA